LEYNGPVDQYQGTIGSPESEVGMLLDEDHSRPSCARRMLHPVSDALTVPWRKPHGHLVDEKGLGALDQGPGQGQHLLLPTGEEAGPHGQPGG
jgi:hypothetical protein